MVQTAKTLPPNNLDGEIYHLGKSFYLKLLLISCCVFIGVVIFTIPFSQIIKQQVAMTLAHNSKCNITYKQLKLNYLLPTISIQRPAISKFCINSQGQTFKRINIKLIRPSFFPLGLRINIKIYERQTPILLEMIIGLTKQVVVINQTNIPATFINKFLPTQYNLKGKFTIKGNFVIAGTKDIKGALLVRSNNFKLGSTSIQGLDIPELNFQKLYLKATINKRKVQLQSVELGNKVSPIQLILKGDALLNFIAFNYTRLNLEGSVRFSKEFETAFPLINMLLSGKKKKDGQYFFSLKGTIKNPRPTF